ncbi:quinone oxidoreductase [Elstera cyanobacteriorum]|uniref:Quinone oxidoreductase n=1 Tax=Elstera cyanobacteriorum TaxID=2022747 RepID=A0A255XUD1_9PROT|nr:quinone oxidoreductase [Elstera cyanobacteriorum]OYQ20609.1 quinone oxidoreductase [Elstera cyanobacteriorum]GFZ99710.1 quinone oxidoreductase [Elstera cyanobacteriorum]
MTKTHAIRLHAFGGPEVLQWEEIELPAPGPNEALIRQTAIGLNFIEIYQRTGLYPLPLPLVLGQEGAGVVEAVGPGVTVVKPGDRVGYASGPSGAYAEKRLYPADRLVPLPDALDDKTAAAILLGGMTARYLVKETFPLKPGHTILFHAAAGGVGQIAVQWAKHLGATVIGTVSAGKVDLAKSLGCDHVLVSGQDDIAAQVKALTGGRGVDVVYDSVGKDTWDASLDALAPRGMMVTYGNASGPVPAVAPLTLASKGSLFLTRPTLGHYIDTRERLLANAEDLFDVVLSGKVKIHVNQTFALKDVAQAHIALAERRTTGATVLLP